MNMLVLISGILALMTTLGHFTMGSKLYLKPMLAADFDAVARKVMHGVFHYVSVFLIASTVALLGFAMHMEPLANQTVLVQFIAIQYAAFAVWQLILALSSGIEKPLFKMFQWVFFVLISLFAWLGV